MPENNAPENNAPENNAPDSTAPYNHDRATHAREEALWAPLSPKERRQWTQALLDFRPHTPSVMTNRMIDDMVNRTGVISLERWIEPLLAFDTAGFSARDWHEIMTSLHVVLVRQPALLADNPAVVMISPTAVVTSASQPAPGRIEIEPPAWSEWLTLRRSGASALTATYAVLRAA